ncbi:MAG: NAD-dependent epimerase/dehydratase family protein [Myxococcales bacterium]|nr:NAD-dependent epimerase/dehydratase family protein [Myxococcales bacterium]
MAKAKKHYLSGKRVLLTGATGYIGSELLPHLEAVGAKVTCTTRRTPTPEGWRHLDLENPGDTEALCRDQDVVLHMAALRGQPGKPASVIRKVNTASTEALYDGAIKAGVTDFIFVSTVGVCGFVANMSETTPYGDDDDPYHRSKADAEELLLRRKGEIERLVIIRPCVVYGERRDDGFVRNLTKLVRTGFFANIGRTSPTLQMVYIQNLIEGMLLLMSKGEHGEIYQLADERGLKVHEIANLIADVAGKRILPFKVPVLAAKVAAAGFEKLAGLLGKRAFMSPHKLQLFIAPQSFDIRKAKSLGYSPSHNVESALRKSVAALLEAL